jgi:hypothetical protein
MKDRYVKYIAGSGCTLHAPLSDGQFSFLKNLVYKVPTYADLVRLVSTGKFIEVDAKGKPIVEQKPAEVKPKKQETERLIKDNEDKGELTN